MSKIKIIFLTMKKDFVLLLFIFLVSGCVTEVVNTDQVKILKTNVVNSKLGLIKVDFIQVGSTFDIQITSENFKAKEGLYTFSIARMTDCPKKFDEIQNSKGQILSADSVLIKENSKNQSIYRKISTDQLPDKLILTARLQNKDSLLFCSTFN